MKTKERERERIDENGNAVSAEREIINGRVLLRLPVVFARFLIPGHGPANAETVTPVKQYPRTSGGNKSLGTPNIVNILRTRRSGAPFRGETHFPRALQSLAVPFRAVKTVLSVTFTDDTVSQSFRWTSRNDEHSARLTVRHCDCILVSCRCYCG